jgi:L-ascorbate metabolism protein UlaG (beta-lactamase superfamily)
LGIVELEWGIYRHRGPISPCAIAPLGPRVIKDSPSRLWWLCAAPARTPVYHAGDTAYFRASARSDSASRQVALSIGAYDHPNSEVHTSPADAIEPSSI